MNLLKTRLPGRLCWTRKADRSSSLGQPKKNPPTPLTQQGVSCFIVRLDASVQDWKLHGRFGGRKKYYLPRLLFSLEEEENQMKWGENKKKESDRIRRARKGPSLFPRPATHNRSYTQGACVIGITNVYLNPGSRDIYRDTRTQQTQEKRE